MPLNPPSFVGQDVWYSPNVFVNKVQTALWQPAQGTDPAQDPAIQAWTDGCDIAADGTVQGRIAAEAYVQNLINQGITTPEEVAAARVAGQPSAATQRSNVPPPVQNPVSLDTNGLQNLTSWPRNQPLSQYFTLEVISDQYWNTFVGIPPSGSPLTNNLPKGQVVANLRLLCVNTLDKIKGRYPTMQAHSTWRGFISSPTTQHNKGQAADISFGSMPFEQYYDVACWIRDNVDFDQLLLEYNNNSCWVHVSWQARNSGDTRQRAGRGWAHVATFNCLNPPGAVAQQAANGRPEERYEGLINLAGPLGLSGYTMRNRPPRSSPIRQLGTIQGQAPR